MTRPADERASRSASRWSTGQTRRPLNRRQRGSGGLYVGLVLLLLVLVLLIKPRPLRGGDLLGLLLRLDGASFLDDPSEILLGTPKRVADQGGIIVAHRLKPRLLPPHRLFCIDNPMVDRMLAQRVVQLGPGDGGQGASTSPPPSAHVAVDHVGLASPAADQRLPTLAAHEKAVEQERLRRTAGSAPTRDAASSAGDFALCGLPGSLVDDAGNVQAAGVGVFTAFMLQVWALVA